MAELDGLEAAVVEEFERAVARARPQPSRQLTDQRTTLDPEGNLACPERRAACDNAVRRSVHVVVTPLVLLAHSGLSALGISALATRAWGQAPPLPYAITGADAFPQQDPSLVKDAVGASHGNFARIRELVEKQPAMARASIDWGFGDWETCIDAAAHVGNKPIADFLLTTRRAADDLFGGDDGPARRREGVRRGPARHSEDARSARHHADVACESRRS